MEIKRVALVLADISGYTRFMKMHTMSLLHAEVIVSELLEAVIDRANFPLTVSKIEGDAVLLHATLDESAPERAALQDILEQVKAFFTAFKLKERALIACDACVCEGCSSIGRLKLKALLHVGQAVIRKIRQFEELAGEDVILIHRLLKNSIPEKEYILLTAAFQEASGGMADGAPETRSEEYEDIGKVVVKVYRPAQDPAAPPDRPAPGPPRPGTEFGALAGRFNRYAVNRMLGRVPPPSFTNLPGDSVSKISLWDYFVVGMAGNTVGTIRHWLRRKDARPGRP